MSDQTNPRYDYHLEQLPPRPAESFEEQAQKSLHETALQSLGAIGVRRERLEVYSLPEGEIRFSYPSRLSVESHDELLSWMNLIKRKIARQVGPHAAPNGQ